MAAQAQQATLPSLVEEREKEGMKVAKNIVAMLEAIGTLKFDGNFAITKDEIHFLYNRLLDTVTVEHGGTDVFAASLALNRCTVYKKGSWTLVYNDLMAKVDQIDKSTIKTRNDVRTRENLGLPKF